MIKIFRYLIFFTSLCFVFLSAQEMPYVYDVEHTGADCPIPNMPAFNALPNITNLPDPFEWSDGRGRMVHFSDWRYRRAEIFAEIQHYEVGLKPPRPDSITASFDGNILTVDVTKNGETLTLTSTINLPQGEGPFPAMIGMGGTSLPDSLLSNRGIVTIPFNFGQVMAHTQTRGNEPINALYPDLVYMGAYSAWPWGVSRLIDGLELVQEDLNIDLQHIGVSGCSFAGKMAIFSGAFDERIALTIGIESGGGGYTTWRYSEVITESVETLGNTSHAWFIENLFQFADDVPKLPYDHHELMALVAPRALFVTGNPGWTWLADESGYVGSNGAKKVYEALGIADRIGYSQIGGHNHCAIPEAQIPELQSFLDRFMLGIDTVVTNVATSPYTTNLSPWINWSVPELTSGLSFFGKASLIYPANKGENLDTSVTFVWQNVEDAQEYIFQLSTDPTFKSFTATDTTTDTLKTVNSLLKGKRYYWRIQVKNSGGELGPWSGPANFFTAIPVPAMPPLVTATMIQNRRDYITLTWRITEYAAQYRIQISRNIEFTTVAVPSVTTTDTSKSIGGLAEGQKYYWRIRAENVAGEGPWSDAGTFTILAAPTDLELSQSALGEITLSWEDNSFAEDGYIIERKQGDDIMFSVYDTLKGSIEEYVDKAAQGALSFTYRVQAFKDSILSDYSNEESLIVSAIADGKKMPTNYSLSQNYPNPFNPTTKIQFALPRSSTTRLVIYDLLGSKIKTLLNEQLNAGYHEAILDASDLTSGIYFYRIQSGDFDQTRKMILMK